MKRAWVVVLLVSGTAAAAPAFHAVPPVGVVQIAVNDTGSAMVTLHNDGTSSVTAGDIVAEAGCDAAVHLAPITGFTLGAGLTRPLTVSCSAAPAGMQRCRYNVRGTSGDSLLELEGVCASGNVAALSPSTASVDFGTIAIGGALTQTLVIQNTAGTSINHVSVETTDLDGNFTIQAPCNPDARACDASLLPVAAGGSFSLTVACTPRATGALSAQLYLTTNIGSRLVAPIALTCTGAAASGPVLAVPPEPVDVGDVEVLSGTATARIHLTNTGTLPLTLSDIQTVDAGTGAALDWTYSATAPCNSHVPDACSLAPGSDVALDLVFDPSALGVRDAALLINYHDTIDRSVSVPLRGRGQGATLELVGIPSLDFGTLPLGVTGKLTFTVLNRGTHALTDGMVTPPVSPVFGVTPGSTFSVPVGGATTFTVSCTPAVSGGVTDLVVLRSAEAVIDMSLSCAGNENLTLFATPPAIVLGDVRTDKPVMASTVLASTGAQVSISASLAALSDDLSIETSSGTTPSTITLSAMATPGAPLTTRINITGPGPALSIPVTGNPVRPDYNVPSQVSLGTFCVQEATTPRTLTLSASGSATIAVMAPALADPRSPFDLSFIAPLSYPTTLATTQTAQVSVVPKRQATKGIYTDDVVWTTDVTAKPTSRTSLSATFVDQGFALAPGEIHFDAAPIHIDSRNARQVTLQNCDVSTLHLDPPQVPLPFSIDSPSFPTILLPNETVTFSVGFHPTKADSFTGVLTISAEELEASPLHLLLDGQGVATGGDSDGGSPTPDTGKTSFYACGSCATGDSSGAFVALVGLWLTSRRRRRYL